VKFGPRCHEDPLCRVVLVEPLIPENTGNISRTCVATGSELHLVEPMGFEISEKRVKRAGLDYWSDLAWQRHVNSRAWIDSLSQMDRVFMIETSGTKTIYDVEFQKGDWIVFGKETVGLDRSLLEGNDAVPNAQILSIPMPGTTRSLNLSNAVAITVFEILRQNRSRRGAQDDD
jgi:tRNA (cytidine/uridine-2'-O-)-methyltransferase